jgi:hypothetical protein
MKITRRQLKQIIEEVGRISDNYKIKFGQDNYAVDCDQVEKTNACAKVVRYKEKFRNLSGEKLDALEITHSCPPQDFQDECDIELSGLKDEDSENGADVRERMKTVKQSLKVKPIQETMIITRKQLRQIIKEEIGLYEYVAKSNVDHDIEIGYDEIKRRKLDTIHLSPSLVGNIIIDMEKSKIPAVKKSVVNALSLLKDKASEEYDLVQKNLKDISSGEKSGIEIKDKKFTISDASLKGSDEWLASIIYHDAYHVEQGTKGWHAKDRETPTNLKQLELLKKLDATPDEITHLTKVIKKGDHSDLNNDGVYDMKDYKLRNY